MSGSNRLSEIVDRLVVISGSFVVDDVGIDRLVVDATKGARVEDALGFGVDDLVDGVGEDVGGSAV